MRRSWLLAFAGVLLLEVAWALVTPLFRGPDEIGHVYRASSVAEGQWGPSGGDVPTRVSREIVAEAAPTCRGLYEDLSPATCRPVDIGSADAVGIASSADKYNPVYYAVVSLPARVLDGASAVWGMRAVSALLCAAFVAWAWVLLTTGARTAFPAMAMLVAASPAVLFGGSVVAPNGLQYAAGLLLWAALLLLLRSPDSLIRSLVAGSVAAGTLVLTHTLGSVWLACIVVCCLLLGGQRRWWTVVRSNPRAFAAAALVVVVCALGAAGWILGASTNTPSAGGEPLADDTKEIGVVPNVILWVLQTVGTMPYRFGLLWLFVYLLWLVPVGALVVLGLRHGSRGHRLAIGTVLLLSALIPTLATAATYDDLGFAWQGKYGLPLLFGGLLVAGDALDRSGRTLGASARTWSWSLLGVLAVTHYLCVLCLGLREAGGDYDDGRAWGLILTLVVPAAVALGWASLLATTGARRPPLVGSSDRSPSTNGPSLRR